MSDDDDDDDCQSLLYVLSLPPLTAAKHIIYD